MQKNKWYYVVFISGKGINSLIMSVPGGITTPEDVTGAMKYIASATDEENVVILNWKHLNGYDGLVPMKKNNGGEND